jgi:hypothetical protein
MRSIISKGGTMIKEGALRDALMALVNSSKTNYIMISAVLAELAAVRETVSGLDPTFADVLETKRHEAEAAADSVVRAVIATYDEIFQRVKNGEVC